MHGMKEGLMGREGIKSAGWEGDRGSETEERKRENERQSWGRGG